jgi:hypothetical protein
MAAGADTTAGTAYQVATWGGTRCEKVADNGLMQPCNPVEPLIEVRQYLGQPATACPDCDLDADGQITLVDLTMARNGAFGPKSVGVGEDAREDLQFRSRRPRRNGQPYTVR